MNTVHRTARIYAALVAVGVTLSWVVALGALANSYAQEATAQALAGPEARREGAARTRVATARSGAENLACKPARASAG